MPLLTPPDELQENNIDIHRRYITLKDIHAKSHVNLQHANLLLTRKDGILHPLIAYLLQMGRLNGWFTYTYSIPITRSHPINVQALRVL